MSIDDSYQPDETAPAMAPEARISDGVEIISQTAAKLPNAPGVYRMIDGNGDVLYVGKAKSLKKRVVSYTRIGQMTARLVRMVAETHAMEIVTTHTEAEALLLESNLIKTLKPRYNILLRDDKSFPYILVTAGHDFPRIVKYRGARGKKGRYFGPFASAGAVNRTLTALQKAFLLRSCSDTVFNNRTRPCLLYQIKRCAGPCVDRISKEAYGDLVGEATDFLSRDSSAVQDKLAADMEQASADMDYETAAKLRDRIRAMAAIRSHQDINLGTVGEADVIALVRSGGQCCVQVFFFRGGQNFGNKAYFPKQTAEHEDGAVLEAFIGQFYDGAPPPREILLSHGIPNQDLMADALSLKADRKVALKVPARGDRKAMVDHAARNAQEALDRRLAESTAQRALLEGVQDIFDLPAPPVRIEVYDNSHTGGTHMVGGMIVAGPDGPMKNAYRKFNIKNTDLVPGDDYGAMREVLTRRFARAQKEDPDRTSDQWPDLVLLDGGKGQLSSGLQVLEDLGLEDVPIAAIAKGPDRNAGRETFFLPGQEEFTLPENHPVLYYLQRLRDEAHRFAITTHRAKRAKAISASPLDEIQGIGGKRKKALLHAFGSAKGVSRAGLKDLEAVDGISAAMAKKIYDHFQSSA